MSRLYLGVEQLFQLFEGVTRHLGRTLTVILVECKADKRQSPLYLLICHQATKRVHRQTTILVAKLVTRNGRRQILDERTNMYPSTAMVEIYLSFHGDQNSFLHRRMYFRH